MNVQATESLDPIQAVEKAQRMFLDDQPLLAIKDTIWFGCGFHSFEPVYIPKSLWIAFTLYNKYKDNDKENIAHCMLLLGKIFSVKEEHLPACRFFLCAQKLFRSDYWIPAMEFFREELRTLGAKTQIKLSREEFREKYKNDTPQVLVKEYGCVSSQLN